MRRATDGGRALAGERRRRHHLERAADLARRHARRRKLVRALTTPGLLDSLEARVGAPYTDGIDASIAADERRARFAARLIEWKRPALALASLTALDHEQHQHGPFSPEAFAVLERVDGSRVAAARLAVPFTTADGTDRLAPCSLDRPHAMGAHGP